MSEYYDNILNKTVFWSGVVPGTKEENIFKNHLFKTTFLIVFFFLNSFTVVHYIAHYKLDNNQVSMHVVIPK